MEILHENSKGIKIVRNDLKKRSTVKVIAPDGHTLHTYRMNNIPFYDHPYLSWANLDCCDGWTNDSEYLNTAVQKHLKLVAGCIEALPDGTFPTYDKSEADAYYFKNAHDKASMNLARKGCLRDFYDIESILSAYDLQGISVDKDALLPYFGIPLIKLFSGKESDMGFDYARPKTMPECIIDGLCLGYPIESTASFIFGHR